MHINIVRDLIVKTPAESAVGDPDRFYLQAKIPLLGSRQCYPRYH